MRENWSSRVLTLSDTNQSVQSQEMDRSLKFWILEEECYLCSENKGSDQLCSKLSLNRLQKVDKF